MFQDNLFRKLVVDNFAGGGGSAVAYAWFVWKKGYTGATQVQWI